MPDLDLIKQGEQGCGSALRFALAKGWARA